MGDGFEEKIEDANFFCVDVCETYVDRKRRREMCGVLLSRKQRPLTFKCQAFQMVKLI